MLVVVNQPHINDFKIEGSISPITLDNLKNIEKRFQKLWQRNSQRFSMSLFLGLFKKAKTGRFDRSF